jgi:hypothetical protein
LQEREGQCGLPVFLFLASFLLFAAFFSCSFVRWQRRKLAEQICGGLAAVAVVFYVDLVVHGGGGGVGFFVGGDLGFVLQAGAYVVQAF